MWTPRTAGLTAILFAAVAVFGGARLEWGHSSRLEVRFVDAETGFAVRPRLQMLQSLNQRSIDDRELPAAGPNGTIELLLPREAHRLLVLADGYSSASAEFVPGEVATLVFQLDPEKLPPEIEPELLRQKRSHSSFLACGFIVDDESGMPIRGAIVRERAGRSTLSDERGYFELSIPVTGRSPVGQIAFYSPGYGAHIRTNVGLWASGDSIYRIRLVAGGSARNIDERLLKNRPALVGVEADGCASPCYGQFESDLPPLDDGLGGEPPPLPKSIRVGRSCASRTTCTVVEVVGLQTYCKRVLSSEWYSCWGSLTGGMDSLRAGAVAVRSYGVSFVYSPATSTYDICDTTACQVMGDSYTSNASAAVDQTSRHVLLTGSGSVARAEYSAENNDSGCGDGFSGTGSSWPCISDPVCSGFAQFGHGRGLCQWGSARWATGKRLSSSQACTSSAPPTGQPTKNWQQILAHYYPSYALAQGATAVPTGYSSAPNPVTAASRAVFALDVAATSAIQRVLLGASIAPTGSGSWLSDPPHDALVQLPAGVSNPERLFDVPYTASAGIYDAWLALYYDRNNDGDLGSGDFVIDDARFNGSLSVAPSAVAVKIEPGFRRVRPGQTAAFAALISGTHNPSASWSIVSGPGTIHPSTGLFAAASALGTTTTIRATSVADPTRSATAKVFVIGRSGPGG